MAANLYVASMASKFGILDFWLLPANDSHHGYLKAKNGAVLMDNPRSWHMGKKQVLTYYKPLYIVGSQTL